MQNKEIYQAEINQSLTELKQHPIYKILIPFFSELDKTFIIKKYLVTESLTNLVASNFLNTKQLLTTLTTVQFSDKQEPYFSSLNKQLTKTFYQLVMSLQKTKWSVNDQLGFEQNFSNLVIDSYQQYVDYIKLILQNQLLTKMLSTWISFFQNEINEDFFNQMMEEIFFDFKNYLAIKTDDILKQSLTLIYQQFGLNLSTIKKEKIEERPNFLDFDNFDFIEVVDVKTAFIFFELPETATFSEVQKAYKKLAKKYHPDNQTMDADFKKMTEINLAYTFLKEKFSK